MDRHHQVLLNQVRTFRQDVLDVVKDVTEKEAEFIPKNFRNNIRWNLGHIYLDQFMWIETLTNKSSETVKRFNNWFGFGTTPQDFTSETPKLDELVSLLKGQPDVIEDLYVNRLNREYPSIDMGIYTIEQVLVRTIFHEGMHLQAIMDIKKFL
ncbi:DinB family protein [Oceanobacillus kapialis]|uniref:DinB family protein n=1 Tax=Oceanobacillus kapialis TaxID=481353 RepID=A0ABW5Q0L5_9BACI